MNIPDELMRTAKEAFAGRPPSADGVFGLDSGRNPWRALDDALTAVFEELDLPPDWFDPPEPDVCRPVDIDGETIRVRGEQPVNEETKAAMADVVRAAKRRHEAEKAAERAEIERQVRQQVAKEIEDLLKDAPDPPSALIRLGGWIVTAGTAEPGGDRG